MMGSGAIFVVLSVGVTAAIAAWVLRPLWRSDPGAPMADRPPAALLMRQRAAVLDLRDLDADLAVGRVGPEEHARRRSEVLREGAAAMAEVDRWFAETAAHAETTLRRLEADVAAARARFGPVGSPCPGCGSVVQPRDRYCAACGRPTPADSDRGRERASIDADEEG